MDEYSNVFIHFLLTTNQYYAIITTHDDKLSSDLNLKEIQMQVTTKKAQLTEALLNGEALTVAQIRARFGIANPTATISDIRFSGVPVYANARVNSKGQSVTRYRTGKASRAVVAAGYRALAMGLFTQE